MTCGNASAMVCYLESLRNLSREQDTKTKKLVELAFTETPAKLARGCMPTESGSGRLATGGKTFGDSPGKSRMPPSAPANRQGVKKSLHPTSQWINRGINTNREDLLAADTERSPILGGIYVPEPNQTVFSKILPFKRTIYSAEKSCVRNRKLAQSAKLPDLHSAYRNITTTTNKKNTQYGQHAPYQVKSIPNSVYEYKKAQRNSEIYKQSSPDNLKKFVKEYMENNRDGFRKLR